MSMHEHHELKYFSEKFKFEQTFKILQMMRCVMIPGQTTLNLAHETVQRHTSNFKANGRNLTLTPVKRP
jgi:hypothetical protein